jgi:hypothetical protein
MRQKPRRLGMNSIQAIQSAEESAQAVQAAATFNTCGLHLFLLYTDSGAFRRDCPLVVRLHNLFKTFTNKM